MAISLSDIYRKTKRHDSLMKSRHIIKTTWKTHLRMSLLYSFWSQRDHVFIVQLWVNKYLQQSATTLKPSHLTIVPCSAVEASIPLDTNHLLHGNLACKPPTKTDQENLYSLKSLQIQIWSSYGKCIKYYDPWRLHCGSDSAHTCPDKDTLTSERCTYLV